MTQNNLAGYVVTRFLTRSRFSRLYQVWDERLRRSVVIKVFAVDPRQPPPPFTVSEWRTKFDHEGQCMACLDHPNILPILHSGTFAKARPYHVFPYLTANLPGLIGFDVAPADFDKASERERPKALAPNIAIKILGQLCAALTHLHGRGIVHRDIKPDNVLLTSRQALGVRLCDFGMAKIAGDPGLLPGEWIGTPNYMAPEQQANAAAATDRSDIYSTCVMGFRMLTGFLPTQSPPIPEHIPDRLLNLLTRGLSPTPDTRPTAKEMLDALLILRSE